jgi:serine/threonine-protein kinase RsbW
MSISTTLINPKKAHGMTTTTDQKIKFASRYENLALAEKLVNDVSDEYHLGEDYYSNMLVAVTEAVNNAIQHGNKSNPEKQIELEFKKENNKLLFIVRDEGEGFDYDNIPDPTSPENIEKINGRGVFLMKSLSDGISFSENGRVVELDFTPETLLVN